MDKGQQNLSSVRRMPSLRKYSCIETQRMRRIGVRFFNEDPFSGLRYLQANGIMKQEAETVASWLLTQDGLSRASIGEFLGSPSSFTLEVLEHYVSMQKLYQQPFVAAMRSFMSNFRIPGEAQKIERILEVFARHFTTRYPTDEDGSGVDERGEPRTTVRPSSCDTAHILSYSIIMLNTDLHNANVKHHMTREEFVRNNRGIDDGKDLPADLLEGIFAEVAAAPFRAKTDPLDELVELEKKIRHLELLEQRLVTPQRRLIMKIPVCLVDDWRRSQAPREHARTLFLFNDLLLVVKKAWNSSSEFVYKSHVPLRSANFEAYASDLYALGVEVHSPLRRDALLRVVCDCQKAHRQFVRQAREMVSEAIVMERLPPSDVAKVASSKPPAAAPESSPGSVTVAVTGLDGGAGAGAGGAGAPADTSVVSIVEDCDGDGGAGAVDVIARNAAGGGSTRSAGSWRPSAGAGGARHSLGGSAHSSASGSFRSGSFRSSKRSSAGDLPALISEDFFHERRGGVHSYGVEATVALSGDAVAKTKYPEISVQCGDSGDTLVGAAAADDDVLSAADDAPVAAADAPVVARLPTRALPRRRPAFRAKIALSDERNLSDDPFISTENFRVRTLSLGPRNV